MVSHWWAARVGDVLRDFPELESLGSPSLMVRFIDVYDVLGSWTVPSAALQVPQSDDH